MSNLRSKGYIASIGLLAVLFYVTHVVIGKGLYPGYDAMRQTISDLTALDAPGRETPLMLAGFYTVAMILFASGLYFTMSERFGSMFKWGLSIFVVSSFIALGYLFFPLSESGMSGATLSDTMHVIVTGLVVVTSVTSLILLGLGFYRSNTYHYMGMISFVTLGLQLIGALLTVVWPSIIGLAERITIYSLMTYDVLLSLWLFKTHFDDRKFMWIDE